MRQRVRWRELVGRGTALGCGLLLVLGAVVWAGTDDPDGLAAGEYPVGYAIEGAKIVVAPGRVIESGTIVVRKGVITAVGRDVEVPYDVETIAGKGLVVYPGFIDLGTTIGQRAGVERSATGKGRAVNLADAPLVATPPDNRRGLTPEFDVATVLDLSDAVVEPRRRLGFTALVSYPEGAIVTGRSALLSTSGMPRRESILKPIVALHVNLAPPSEPAVAAPGQPGPGQQPIRRRGFAAPQGPGENPYPRVLMGSIAHLRQAMLDADHQERLKAYQESHGGPHAPYDPALEVLAAARNHQIPVWWQANTRDEIHRVLDLSEEFGVIPAIVGGREAGKVVERLRGSRAPVVFQLNYAEIPKVPTVAEYRKKAADERDVPLRVLESRKQIWDEELSAPAALARAGVPIAFATQGLDRPETALAVVRQMIKHGLTADQALQALTLGAASIAGVDGRLGTLEIGKLGHVIALSADLSDEKSTVKYVLVDGRKFEIKPEERPQGKRGRPGGAESGSDEESTAEPRSKSASSAAELVAQKGVPSQRPGQPAQKKGRPSADLTRSASPRRRSEPQQAESAAAVARSVDGQTKSQTPTQPGPPFHDAPSELEADRKPSLHTGGDAFIKDAVILTVTHGTIPRGSILIEKGKIRAFGPDLAPPPGVKMINARGLVAMPGMIDTHSHIAIQGGVNEGTLSVVPEVRVKDVVEGNHVSMYRAIAGGLTAARLLHGSANTIGGQDAVIKLKYGLPARELIVRDAPQGVKFALGENVTRSRGRFPNTRMGVQSVIELAFDQAKAYRSRWNDYKRLRETRPPAETPPPPRVDLRLEALAGILDGSIRIHSHCYRSDEILMLLATAERYGVRVQSLQHVLEGYKVAAEIAAHGASASTFSDWWAYKIEAYDAIPYNAALLTSAGVNVCIKSDDAELMRHLNLEAAKMVRYGGLSEAQALALVTINPARELGLDNRMGSIEVGKDGDVALFNGHPLDAYSRCELVLIDGEVYFERKPKDGRPESSPTAAPAMPQAAAELRSRTLDITPQPKDIYAFTGAHLHPVSCAPIKDGVLVVTRGKISAVGPAGTPIPPEAQTIPLAGLDVWPGMIDAGSTVGLFEIGSLSETQDFADSAQYQPELRTSVALHPDSEHIPVTRLSGVLATYVEPSGGIMNGQGCLINLNGWVPREMVVADALALNVTIPAHVPRTPEPRRGPGFFPGMQPQSGGPGEAIRRRKETLDQIRQYFKKAAAYDRVRKTALERGDTPPAPDPRLEALAPYATGKKLVILHAEHPVEIEDAIAIAAELKLKAALAGGSGAWAVVDKIKQSGMPVLLSGTLRLPQHDYDPYDAIYSTPARLHAAGIPFAIRSQRGGPSEGTAARNLPFEAATAVAFGLPRDEALRSVTLAPAQILGVADEIGSLDVGKRANIVITAGDLLEPTTPLLGILINGQPIPLESRHTRLYEKYQKRLELVRKGRARLGLDRPNRPSMAAGN